MFYTIRAIFIALCGTLACLQAAAAMPATTTSRYVNTVDRTTAYNEGCAQGSAGLGGLVILDYGQPWYQNGSYGTYLVSPLVFVTNAQIQNAVQGYLDGFYHCSSPSPQLRLGVGTNNYSYRSPQVTAGAGQAWGQMINNLNAYISSKGYASQEFIRGANDMELDWNYASTTRQWLDAYAAATSLPLYDYGDAAGCPPYGSCDNGWTQNDVWYVAWGSPVGYPVPEIYTADGGTTNEWYNLSLYSYLNHGGRMDILLAFTQYAACGCGGGTLTPAQAFAQLQNKLQSDSRTSQSLYYSSDITYAN